MTQVKCPHCENGIMAYTVESPGKPTEHHTMRCVTCDGAGTIEKSLADAMEDFWCRCGNPSGDVTLHGEGSAICGKHHYTCDDCGRIVQVG